MNPGKAPARARFDHERPVDAPRDRVGTFPGADGSLRIQSFVERDGAVIVDPLEWIAAEDPADLGRWA